MSKNIGITRTKEEISALLTEWEQSKLNKKNFCDQKGINYQTFIGWFVQKRNKGKLPEKKFIPVQIEQSGNALFAEIHLSSNKKIILHQPVSAEFLQGILKC